jgi:CO/xanthine dehydrogenase FAD-binding subunit
MEFLQPASWNDALAARAAHPGATAVWGATDVMVDINFGRERPEAILDLTRVRELAEWDEDGETVRIGAGVSYARTIAEIGNRLPGLARASRTVGSPQIRNRGTIGGNIGSSSPAGDALPPLYASGAEVELASTAGSRRLPLAAFITGPKRNVLAADELIAAVHVPVADGPQQFSKVGTRNAMVIAVCSFALALHPRARRVGACIGSAAPTPLRPTAAEEFVEGVLEERGLWDAPAPLAPAEVERFGELVAAAAQPIDDVRGSAAYRRHALAVLARRSLAWAWEEHRA